METSNQKAANAEQTITAWDGNKQSVWQTTGLDYEEKQATAVSPNPNSGEDTDWKEDAGWVVKDFAVKLPPPESTVGADSVASYGIPITRQAAIRMVREGYWQDIKEKLQELQQSGGEVEDELDKLLNTYLAVTFSKEVLLFLLAQHTCEGIRFYFCKNQNWGKSLVLVGVDKDNRDLGTTNASGSIIPGKADEVVELAEQNTAIVEVGGPKTVKDYQDYFNHNKANLRQDSFVKTVGEYFDL